MNQTLRVEALTPLLFRDARPFAATADEARATSLPLPPPGTVAGLLRTHIGTRLGWDWRDQAVVAAANRIRLAGFHLEYHVDQPVPVVAAPRTAVVYREPDTGALRVMRLSPRAPTPHGGCTTPDGLLPLAVTEDAKPEPGYRLWDMATLQAWLAGATDLPDPLPEPPTDQRVHVAIQPERGTAADGMLYTTEFRAWEHHDGARLARWSLIATVSDAPPLPPGRAPAHFGGERRPVVITPEPAPATPMTAGPALREALTGVTEVAMHLLTPAVFTRGWRPGWLDGTAPHPALAGAQLVAAAVGRPETVSGWSYETGRRGPKPTWWAAPAGSTFFLRLPRPLTEADLNELWLTSVSDRSEHRDNGYGTAVWGVWNR